MTEYQSAQCGKKPEKEFRGVFNVRIKPEMHRCAALEAAKEGVTMNQFVSEAIQEKLAEKGVIYEAGFAGANQKSHYY